ncbi:hypothetical protein HaLaN_05141, partial [Haematococcus lacustris]
MAKDKGPGKKQKASRYPQGKQRQERRDGWTTRRRQVPPPPYVSPHCHQGTGGRCTARVQENQAQATARMDGSPCTSLHKSPNNSSSIASYGRPAFMSSLSQAWWSSTGVLMQLLLPCFSHLVLTLIPKPCLAHTLHCNHCCSSYASPRSRTARCPGVTTQP